MPNYLTELSPDNNTHVYQIKDKEAAPIDLLKDTVGWVGKNRLQILASVVTNTVNGVTFTVNRNGDGEVTEIDIDTNGSATSARIDFYLNNSGIPVSSSKSYKLSGCTGGGGSTYRLQLLSSDSSVVKSCESGEVSFNGSDFTGKTVHSRITIYSGTTMSHVKFYPMLRDASIIDSTFEPYHESVEQTLRDAEVIKGKNRLNNVAPTRTNKGVTFTVNADKSVTRSGTASGGVAFSVLTGKGAENNSLDVDYTTPIFKAGERVVSLSFIQFKYTDGTYGSMNAGVVTTLSKDIGIFYTAVENGQSANDTIYPMVCTEEEWNKSHDFEPYYIPLKDKLTELATVQESACTNVAGTVQSNNLNKVGKTVELFLSLDTVSASAWDTIAKIPSGYRPKYNIRVGGYDRTTNNPISFQIRNDGDMKSVQSLSATDIVIYAIFITS